MRKTNNTRYHPGIRIDRIPASGFSGLLFTVATLLTFASLPEIRVFILIAVIAALPVAAVLHFWHTQTRW